MPGKSIRRRHALMKAEDDYVVIIAILWDIADSKIEDIAFKPRLDLDNALKFAAQGGQLIVKAIKLLAPDAIIDIPSGMLAYGDSLKPQFYCAKHIGSGAVLAMAVNGMCMQIVQNLHNNKI